jgi:ferredoxin-NADP reductase
MTEMRKSHEPWHGETGLNNKGMLGRYVKYAVSHIYYIAGPSEMAKGLHTMLNEAGVDDDDIRTEEFAG